jgi:membrane associated rhomboid family serine protease
MGYGSGGGFMPFAFRHVPVVRNVLIASAAIFLLYFLVFPLRPLIGEWLVYQADGGLGWLLKPWTWFTYVLLNLDPWGMLFGGYFFYMVGGMLERSWGRRNFVVLFAAVTAICALAFVPASYIFQVPFSLAGWLLPVSSLFVAWAAMDPDQEINLYGVLPVRIKWLAIADVLIIYFTYGFRYGALGPIIGLFALAGPAAAWFYVRKMPRLAIGFRPAGPRREPLLREEPRRREPTGREREDVKRGGFNPLRKRQEQMEIDRLRKLLGDDDDRPVSRH